MPPRIARSQSEMRELCEQLILDLELDTPFTPELMCRELSRTRARRVKIIYGDLQTTTGMGHLIAKPRRDVIAVHQLAPRDQQAHVIFHEVMHLVCGHLESSSTLMCGALLPAGTGSDAGDMSTLYADWMEQEAEIGATLLSELSHRRARPSRLGPHADPAAARIAAAFGLSRGTRA